MTRPAGVECVDEVDIDDDRTDEDHAQGAIEAPPVVPPTFADGLFTGSRFFFWTLGPISAFAGLSLLLTIDDPWSLAGALRMLLGACGLLFALALASPRRSGCAARAVSATVFVLCAGYVVDEWLQYRSGARQPTNPGAASLEQAIRAFMVFGLPSLWFTLRRRPRQ